MSDRIKKVNKLLKKEISQLILHEVYFDNALVTINQVDTSSDLKSAKVKIVIYPEKETKKVFEILKNNIFFIQQGLNKRLNNSIKYVPKIKFVLDEIETQAQETEKILNKLKS